MASLKTLKTIYISSTIVGWTNLRQWHPIKTIEHGTPMGFQPRCMPRAARSLPAAHSMKLGPTWAQERSAAWRLRPTPNVSRTLKGICTGCFVERVSHCQSPQSVNMWVPKWFTTWSWTRGLATSWKTTHSFCWEDLTGKTPVQDCYCLAFGAAFQPISRIMQFLTYMIRGWTSACRTFFTSMRVWANERVLFWWFRCNVCSDGKLPKDSPTTTHKWHAMLWKSRW